MENVSLNLDLDHNPEDDDDIDDRHKEIQGLLSTAFDDLSSLSEDEEEYSNEFKKFSINGINGDNECRNTQTNGNGNDWNHMYVNGLTSTPRVYHQLYPKSKNNLWPKVPKNHLNVSDILEDEEEELHKGVNGDLEVNDNEFCVEDVNNQMNGQFDSKSSVENARTEQLFGTNERSFSQKHVQLLIEENQRLSNELLVSQQKLSTIDGNYEGLQYRLKELTQVNAEKENQLVRLEARIQSLEVNINVERETKEEFQRKVSVCESTIESLQYQLMEIERSDCLVRRQEIHDSVVNSLKAKHENELILLKTEIERLKAELSCKETEMNAMNSEMESIKCQNNETLLNQQFKDMIKSTKDLWEQEMKGRVEKDIKEILDLHERNWTKSAKQKLMDERNRWEQELQIEILDVIKCLRVKTKLSVDSLPENVGLRFVSLLNLWRALEESCDTREQALRLQTHKLNDAKLQLEEALNESRLNSPAKSSSNDHILRELRNELQKVSEEALVMTEKLHKYKLHYHQLVRRHKHEIERIKEEFAHILESLKRDL
ncbi:unnamed protein product [Oppiella nova]|uniref:Uncharacterized protein n=1 Tax=Oppiella nova TaxID=334625 RepID=A0A7R9LL16_9ACAR|nr:unnamed protein product [Oppiella nova]CAG2164699.1 unnamed protein product [Oppiella nova]